MLYKNTFKTEIVIIITLNKVGRKKKRRRDEICKTANNYSKTNSDVTEKDPLKNPKWVSKTTSKVKYDRNRKYAEAKISSMIKPILSIIKKEILKLAWKTKKNELKTNWKAKYFLNLKSNTQHW